MTFNVKHHDFDIDDIVQKNLLLPIDDIYSWQIGLRILQCTSQFCVLIIVMSSPNSCCEFSQSKCIIIQIRNA